MHVTALTLEGAFHIHPTPHPDDRGAFWESCRTDVLAAHLGYRPVFVQSNMSVSHDRVVRGVHFARFPESQAKYVTAVRGRFTDLIVDVRVGSPTFGQHVAVELDATRGDAVYVSEGLGHALISHAPDSAALYLVTSTFNPQREGAVAITDPALGLHEHLPSTPVMSQKDAAAPTLAEASQAGLLPTYAEWTTFLATQTTSRASRDAAGAGRSTGSSLVWD